MAPRVTMLLCVLSLLPGVHAVARELDTAPARDEAIAAARASAEEWLALLDASDWAETYEQSGQMLKNLVSPDRWARRMSVTLGPPGEGRVPGRAVL